MAKAIGRVMDLGVGVESPRGGGLTPTFWIPKSSYSLEDKVNKAPSRQSYGNIALDGNQAIPSRVWSEGTLEMDMMDSSFGVFLYALLGSKSVAGPTDSAYTHTFTLSNTNQHPSLAVMVKQSSLATLMFKLAMVESMQIEINTDDLVKVTVNFKGKKSVGSTAGTVTYTAHKKFVGRDLTFKIATLTSGLAAASNIPLKSLSLNFEKNLYVDHALGTVQPIDILNQGFRLTGELELDYENRTYADLFTDGGYRAVRVNLTNRRTDALIGVSTNPAFNLDLSRVEFSSWEGSYPNDEIAKQTLSFTALYDITNGNVINSCTLVNTTTSY